MRSVVLICDVEICDAAAALRRDPRTPSAFLSIDTLSVGCIVVKPHLHNNNNIEGFLEYQLVVCRLHRLKTTPTQHHQHQHQHQHQQQQQQRFILTSVV